MTQCQAVQSDYQNWRCDRCGTWWDADDKDPPECLTLEQIQKRAIQKIKRELNEV